MCLGRGEKGGRQKAKEMDERGVTYLVDERK
jgi:hypothetical protein